MNFHALIFFIGFLITSLSFSQSNPEFVSLRPIVAAVYTPNTDPEPHIAFLVAHRTGNSLDNVACKELARRGFMALCFNTRFVNNETEVDWEKLALDVKIAVDFARNKPEIEKVVLLGHSGGSPLMSFYQAVAEKGVSFCKGLNKLVECSEELANLMPADGMVYPDAHPGNGVQALHGLNPPL